MTNTIRTTTTKQNNILRFLRQNQGLTQEKMGNIVRYHSTYISKLELGVITASKDVLLSYSLHFNIDLEYLTIYYLDFLARQKQFNVDSTPNIDIGKWLDVPNQDPVNDNKLSKGNQVAIWVMAISLTATFIFAYFYNK